MMATKKTPAIKHNINTSNSLKRKRSKKYYQTKEWRNKRTKKKKQDRKKDMERVVDFYESHSHISSFDLNKFLYESDMPMCAQCEEEERLTPAYYLDHIHRIRAGGDKFNDDNLQWLCKHCDAVKRSAEGRE